MKMEKPTGKVRKGKFSVPTKSTSRSVLPRNDDYKKSGKIVSIMGHEKLQVKDKTKWKIDKDVLQQKQHESNVASENVTSKLMPGSATEDISKNLDKIIAAPNVPEQNNDTPENEIIDDMLELETELPKSRNLVSNNDKKHKAPVSLTDEEYEEIFRSVLRDFETPDHNPQEVEKPRKIEAKEEKDQYCSHHVWNDINKRDQTSQNMRKPKQMKKTGKVHQLSSSDINSEDHKMQRTQESKKLKKSSADKENQNTSPQMGENIAEEEEGTWIQCTNELCNKWRYVCDIQDPMSVPEMWECSMNPDKYLKSCNDAEEIFDEKEHIITKYTLGSLVWVKMDGFPWKSISLSFYYPVRWPGMIECDPDYDLYFELPNEESMNPITHHVTFFGKQVSRAWIKTTHILPYTKQASAKFESSKKNSSHKWERESALKDAEKAFSMTLKNRLLHFGFSRRYAAQAKTSKSGKHIAGKDDEATDDFEKSPISPRKKKKLNRKSSCTLMESSKPGPERQSQRQHRQSEVADACPKLSGSQPEIADSPPILADLQPELADSPPEIADLQPELADSPPEIADLPPKITCSPPGISDSASMDQHVPDISEVVQEEGNCLNLNIDVDDECKVIISQDKIDREKSRKISRKKIDFGDIDPENNDGKALSLEICPPLSDMDDNDWNHHNKIKDKSEEEIDFDVFSEVDDNQNNRQFRGHCFDRESNSDPLDLLEE